MVKPEKKNCMHHMEIKKIFDWNFRGKNSVQKKKHSRYLRCYHHHNFWLLTYRCAPITTEEPTRQNRTDGMEIDFLKQIRQIRHYTYANTLLSYFWWKFHSQKKFCNRWLILPAAGLNWKHCIYKSWQNLCLILFVSMIK